jgi:hypothetical protein
MNVFRSFELSLNEKSFIEKVEGPKAKQYEILASVPCRAGNDYYTLSQIMTHGEQLVKKLDGINVLAGVQQVFLNLDFFCFFEYSIYYLDWCIENHSNTTST